MYTEECVTILNEVLDNLRKYHGLTATVDEENQYIIDNQELGEKVENLIKKTNTNLVGKLREYTTLNKEYELLNHELEVKKAKLQLNTDFEEILGKKKPTISEKDAYILTQTQDDVKNVLIKKLELDYAKEEYRLSKSSIEQEIRRLREENELIKMEMIKDERT